MNTAGVAITGMGTISPVGNTIPEAWDSLRAGRSGVSLLTGFDTSDYPVKIGGEIRGFDPEEFVGGPDARRMDPYALYAIAAGMQALEDAGIAAGTCVPERFSVLVGTGYGCTSVNAEAVALLQHKGPRAFGPKFAIQQAADVVGSYLSIRFQAFGESFAVNAACASGSVVVGQGMRLIMSGMADVVLVIGADGPIAPRDLAIVSGARALTSTFNDTPERASRPFDRDRSGFVMAAGSAALVLESRDHAAKREAEVLGNLLGYGAASDAYHTTAPHPSGRGAVSAMRKALQSAGLHPNNVDYINAHGTSTLLNDMVEAQAIKDVFEDHALRVPISSTKSMTGHMIGGAGAFELCVAVQAIRTGWVPPTLNCDDPDFEGMDFVPNQARYAGPSVAMSNSFGFGGHCASLIVGGPNV